MSALLLTTTIRTIEDAMSAAELGLVVLDRIGELVRCRPATLLHRGVSVQPTTTTNTGQYRDLTLARVQDRFTIEMAYRITPGGQRDSRDEALVLEEQIRKLLTGLIPGLATPVKYVGTPNRRLHPADQGWWITTMTYTTDRDAVLGG
jgi:hypothetical protein